MKHVYKLGIIVFLTCTAIVTILPFFRETPSNDPVIKFVQDNVKGRRRGTFTKAINLINQRNVKTIVETGTARGGQLAYDGDGGFTIIFGYWSQLHNAELFSVDINPQAIEKAHSVVDQFGSCVHLVEGDSVNFLKNFDRQIDFLYLDSYDFEKNNPGPSQRHHLHEIEVAYDKLTPQSIVMIDDCDLAHGGKGKLVIAYLLDKGWSIYAQDYQVILVNK